MNDLVETVGLAELLAEAAIEGKERDFESIYQDIAIDSANKSVADEIERRVHRFFSDLQIPESATVYDRLILSLRPKDVIATFNWDPLLIQAYKRNGHVQRLPKPLFLHGNVGVGVCQEHRIQGYVESICSTCRNLLTPTKLLYPLTQKNYTDDPFIHGNWEALKNYLQDAYMVTIFGYRAPESDVEAVSLMKTAWGENETKPLAQIELIDIRPQSEVHEAWNEFIVRDHYSYMTSFDKSWSAYYPRRSCDALAWTSLQASPRPTNQIPSIDDLQGLQDWFAPLIDEERGWKDSDARSGRN